MLRHLPLANNTGEFLCGSVEFASRHPVAGHAHCGALTICILWATVDADSAYRGVP